MSERHSVGICQWARLAFVLACATLTLLAVPSGSAAAASQCPWMNASQSPATRASALVAAMSLGDKIQMVTGEYAGPNASSSSPNPLGPVPVAGAVGDASFVYANPALCIPALSMGDATAGIGDEQSLTTAFPDPVALAAAWDPRLSLRYGQVLGKEAFTKGVNVLLGPGMDIARNPLNGRNFEYAGEDPYLAGREVAGIIRGVQSEHVVATAKHFALNDQETSDSTDSSDASQRTMQEIDLPQFNAAVKAGVGAVMCSYNRINSVYACQNQYTLHDALDEQFGFGGWVMSDWSATQSTVPSAEAGLDMEMPSATYYGSALETAVRDGRVSIATLNEMVYRIVYTMFRVGLFDHPPTQGAQAYATPSTTPQSLATATRVAEAGTVLLKNQADVLPIDGPGKRIAVIGPAAGPHGSELCYQGNGSAHVTLFTYQPGVIPPLRAMQLRAGKAGDAVTYADGTELNDAVAAASTADYAVVFICDAEIEGADRPDFNADFGPCFFAVQVVDSSSSGCFYSPIDQNALVAAVAAANPHTIVVIQSGDPVAMPWINHVQGVVDNWYPGQTDGLTVAPILFGDVDPSGHLPLTFPVRLSDDPLQTKEQYPGVMEQGDPVGPHSVYSEGLLVGYRWYDAKGIAPLFPFGYGLSYTSFRFSDLQALSSRDGGALVRFRLTNTGTRVGADVAQVYVGDPQSSGEPPRQLKGFEKVWLDPGQSRIVSIALQPSSFAHWNTGANTWTVDPGSYTIYVGDSSSLSDLPLHAWLWQRASTLAAGVY